MIMRSLDDHKGEDIVIIPLQGKSTLADFMVIVSGQSSRHVVSMAEHVEARLKQCGIHLLGKAGMGQADWVLLDTADVIVHIFRPETRAYYDLERMWSLERISAHDQQEDPHHHPREDLAHNDTNYQHACS